ncbi:MAG: extradiol dioxygenase [Chitinophagaceae bacterium]|nr:MAG: extradiol dioxygenase [Chitinophagaceae bacterium]
MANEFWLNLPVKNINRSKEFFTALGFKFNNGPGSTSVSAPLLIGKKDVMVMLFEEATFKGFVNRDITDTKTACEVLLSFDASSKEEVDEMAKKAVAAGGETTHIPSEMKGPMYGCVFSDPDGHQWNVLYLARQ